MAHTTPSQAETRPADRTDVAEKGLQVNAPPAREPVSSDVAQAYLTPTPENPATPQPTQGPTEP